MSSPISTFSSWLRSHPSIVVSPSLTLRHDSQHGYGYYTFKEFNGIHDLITIPNELQMRPQQCELELPKDDPWVALSLMMLYEHSRGTSSKWSPYLAMLPTSFNMPLFQPHLTSHLTGCDFPNRLDFASSEIAITYATKIKPFITSHQQHFTKQWSTLDAYRLVMGQIMSRAFTDASGAPYMIPCADFINARACDGMETTHQAWKETLSQVNEMSKTPTVSTSTSKTLSSSLSDTITRCSCSSDHIANVHMSYTPAAFIIRTLGHPIPANTQLYLTYGFHLSNADLFRRYGFIDEYNAFNVAEMSVLHISDMCKNMMGPIVLSEKKKDSNKSNNEKKKEKEDKVSKKRKHDSDDNEDSDGDQDDDIVDEIVEELPETSFFFHPIPALATLTTPLFSLLPKRLTYLLAVYLKIRDPHALLTSSSTTTSSSSQKKGKKKTKTEEKKESNDDMEFSSVEQQKILQILYLLLATRITLYATSVEQDKHLLNVLNGNAGEGPALIAKRSGYMTYKGTGTAEKQKRQELYEAAKEEKKLEDETKAVKEEEKESVKMAINVRMSEKSILESVMSAIKLELIEGDDGDGEEMDDEEMEEMEDMDGEGEQDDDDDGNPPIKIKDIFGGAGDDDDDEEEDEEDENENGSESDEGAHVYIKDFFGGGGDEDTKEGSEDEDEDEDEEEDQDDDDSGLAADGPILTHEEALADPSVKQLLAQIRKVASEMSDEEDVSEQEDEKEDLDEKKVEVEEKKATHKETKAATKKTSSHTAAAAAAAAAASTSAFKARKSKKSKKPKPSQPQPQTQQSQPAPQKSQSAPHASQKLQKSTNATSFSKGPPTKKRK